MKKDAGRPAMHGAINNIVQKQLLLLIMITYDDFLSQLIILGLVSIPKSPDWGTLNPGISGFKMWPRS